jgi:ABC-type molybdate transport system substrate-binding protein
VFASANMDHPQAIARGAAVQRFARNRLCVLAHPAAGATAANVVERMLDPALKLGTSTPKADPSGDYAWALFRRIDARGGPWAGSYALLDRKALQLTGGPNSPPPPAGRNVYGALVAAGEAAAARRFVETLLGPAGQALLARHGFAPR